jgi:hypothetical protein
MKRTFCFVLYAGLQLAFGQTQVDLRTQSKSPDFSTFGPTKPMQVGFALPSTCTAGQMFFNTNVAAGQNVYGCTATNTWNVMSVIPSGISSAGIDIGDGTTPGTIRFFPANDPNNFVAWQAPATNTAPITYVLPVSPPTAGQVLSCAAPVTNAATCSWSNGPARTVTNEVWYTAATRIGSSSQCIATTSYGCGNQGPVMDGAILRNGQNDYVLFQVNVPATWTGGLNLTVFHQLQATNTGTGTLQLNYATACVHAGSTVLTNSLTFNTATSVTPNYQSGDYTLGKVDTVSPATAGCGAGDILIIRVDRPSFGTATDGVLVLGMKISLPYTI